MLLDDATSKEQVAAALEAGDDELREDIEEVLDDVKRRWDRGPNYDEDYEPIDMKEIATREDFIDDTGMTRNRRISKRRTSKRKQPARRRTSKRRSSKRRSSKRKA